MFQTLFPKTFSCLAILVMTFVFSGSLYADNLRGRILDPQGNVVVNATIQLFDRKTGEQRNAASSKEGFFNFSAIPAGSYLIHAEASGAALLASEELAVRGDVSRDV